MMGVLTFQVNVWFEEHIASPLGGDGRGVGLRNLVVDHLQQERSGKHPGSHSAANSKGN